MAKGVINLQKESGGATKITSTDGVTNTELVLPESGNIVSVDTAVTDNAIARYDGTTGKLQDSGVVVDDSGNVGIGTSSPSSGGLTIKGNTQNYSQIHLASGNLSNSSRQAYFRAIDGGTNGSIDGNAFSGLQIGTVRPDGAAGTNIAFFTASGATMTEKVKIDPSGNLLLTSGTGVLGYGTGAGGTVTQLTSKSTAVTLNKPSGRITMNNAALAAGTSVTFVVNNNIVSNIDNVTVSGIYDTSAPTTYPENYRIEVSSVRNGHFIMRVTNMHTGTLSDALAIKFSVIKGAIA